jgi:predicted transcriptional regulator
MKIRKLKVGIRDFDESLDDVAKTARAVSAGRKIKAKGHRIFFTSPDALKRFLTPKKLELIRLIRKRHPNSINQLATLARRDFKKVYEDVMSLTETGLLDLTKNGSRNTAPRAADELHLEIVV